MKHEINIFILLIFVLVGAFFIRQNTQTLSFLRSKIDNMALYGSPSQKMENYVRPAIERLENHLDRIESERLAVIIWNTSQKFDIDPYWLEALGQHESWNWEHRKGLSSNDYGLWMVNEDTFDWMKWHPDLRHWNAQSSNELAENDLMAAEFSAVYLRRQLDRYEDYELAILAYNLGPGRVNKSTNAQEFSYYREVRKIFDAME